MKDVIITINGYVNDCLTTRIKVIELDSSDEIACYNVGYPYLCFDSFAENGNPKYVESEFKGELFESHEEFLSFIYSLDRKKELSEEQFFESVFRFLHPDYNIKCVVCA